LRQSSLGVVPSECTASRAAKAYRGLPHRKMAESWTGRGLRGCHRQPLLLLLLPHCQPGHHCCLQCHPPDNHCQLVLLLLLPRVLLPHPLVGWRPSPRWHCQVRVWWAHQQESLGLQGAATAMDLAACATRLQVACEGELDRTFSHSRVNLSDKGWQWQPTWLTVSTCANG